MTSPPTPPPPRLCSVVFGAFLASCAADPPASDGAPSAPPSSGEASSSTAELEQTATAAPPVVASGLSRPTASASAAPQEPKPIDPNRLSFARVKQAAPASGGAPSGGFAAAAARCLADSSCSIEQYAGLVLAAVDAKEAVPCFQLVDGVGVPVDLGRARSCFEASVAREGSCGKSSPSLDRLQLALLVATGRGGTRSSAGARATMQDCFQDGSLSALDEVIVGLEKGQAPSLDSIQICDAGIARTTLHMSACMQLEVDFLDVREGALEKVLLKTFDAATLDAFRAAGAENRKYALALADAAADIYRNGTIAQTAYPGAIVMARSARLLRWEALARGVLQDAPDPKQARADVLARRDTARAGGDAILKGFVSKMEKAYASYRAKEATLFKKLPNMNAAKVDALLDVEWADELDLFAET